MVPGFSRFVLFVFLGLLTAPTRNSPERVRDTIRTFPEKCGKAPGLETPRFSFSQKISVTQRGGATKGGRKQMRANANKCRQTSTNASKRRGENASKRKQTQANANKRKQTLTPPFIVVFYTPFAIPLTKGLRAKPHEETPRQKAVSDPPLVRMSEKRG